MEINRLQALISNYRQAQPEEIAEFERELRNERKSLAEWLIHALPEEVHDYIATGQWDFFKHLRRTGLQNLLLTSEEVETGEHLKKADRKRVFENPNLLLASMLMFPAHEVPLPLHFSDLPVGLRQEFADYLLTPPGVFNRSGEANVYAEHFMEVVDLFYRSLLKEDPVENGEEIQNLFVQKANFIQFYFNEQNLKDTYRKRAELLEDWALKQNARLHHHFTARPLSTKNGYPKRKIGFLSAHFSPQTEVYLLLSYFDKIPRETFHVTLYSLRQTNHPLENYCKSRVDNFVHLPDQWSYQQKADRIRSDDLDLLLIGTNTSAVTHPVTILSLFRMARTHVIVENSPVSTGFSHTDYYISSEFNEPGPDAQRYYTEKLYRVPGMLNYYAYHFDKAAQTISIAREQLRVPEDAVLYFSGANFFKILPELSDLWSRVLSQVPNSYLILMPFNPNWTSRYLARPFTERLQTQMQAYGVDPGRLRLVQKVPTRADVHAVMRLCDIYLDSFPYAGACSMIDPLTVGMPVVCRAGKTMRGNLAAAMLKGANLEEMVVPDALAYKERAVQLGRNSQYRKESRDQIQRALDHYNPFFDTGACGVKIGAAFLDILDRERREI